MIPQTDLISKSHRAISWWSVHFSVRMCCLNKNCYLKKILSAFLISAPHPKPLFRAVFLTASFLLITPYFSVTQAHALIFGLSIPADQLLPRSTNTNQNFYQTCLSFFPTIKQIFCFPSYSAFYKSSWKTRSFWHLNLIIHKMFLSTVSKTLSGFFKVLWQTILRLGISQDFSAISRDIERPSIGMFWTLNAFSFFSSLLQDIH